MTVKKKWRDNCSSGVFDIAASLCFCPAVARLFVASTLVVAQLFLSSFNSYCRSTFAAVEHPLSLKSFRSSVEGTLSSFNRILTALGLGSVWFEIHFGLFRLDGPHKHNIWTEKRLRRYTHQKESRF